MTVTVSRILLDGAQRTDVKVMATASLTGYDNAGYTKLGYLMPTCQSHTVGI